jgi:hypothetical protein
MAALAMAAGLTPIAAASAAPAHSPTSAIAPYCGITWGSQEKVDEATTVPVLTNIRAGRQPCYDRLVFDVRGGNVTGYRVLYVAAVTGTSDWIVPLRGGAKLSIMLIASDYSAGKPTYKCTNCAELVNVSGYPTFRQVAWAGSYRSSTLVGLGVRARLPFRVFTLPGRLVVDVAHHW